jgi:hypothetical protein
MEHLAEITIRTRGQPGAANVSGTSRRLLGLPPSWAIGDLLTPLNPGTSLLLGVLAGALLVLGSLVLADLEYLAERGLLYLDRDRLAGNRGRRCARRGRFPH